MAFATFPYAGLPRGSGARGGGQGAGGQGWSVAPRARGGGRRRWGRKTRLVIMPGKIATASSQVGRVLYVGAGACSRNAR